jgi:serine/threonine protein kinase
MKPPSGQHKSTTPENAAGKPEGDAAQGVGSDAPVHDAKPADPITERENPSTGPEPKDWLRLNSTVVSGAEPAPINVGSSSFERSPSAAVSRDDAASQESAPLPKQIGAYEIESEIGRGGMGVVYKAVQMQLNRPVAVKMIHARALTSLEERLRFLTEAETVAKLRHPNIVQIYEIGLHENQPFIALELIEGGSLSNQTRGVAQPPRAAAKLVEILARTMHHVHRQGIVHCDLKPANILLQLGDGQSPGDGTSVAATDSGSSSSRRRATTPKITDFGLAKHLDAGEGLLRSEQVLGTPNYMAPEQAQGHASLIGPATDIYALGAILYELLTGRPPFVGGHPKEVMLQVMAMEPMPVRRAQPGVPLDMATICMKCLEKQPKNRYATAGELAEELRRYLSGEPIRARPIGDLERLGKWIVRRRKEVALAAAVAGIAIAGAGTAIYFAREAAAYRDTVNELQRQSTDLQRRAQSAEEELRKALQLLEDLRKRPAPDPVKP